MLERVLEEARQERNARRSGQDLGDEEQFKRLDQLREQALSIEDPEDRERQMERPSTGGLSTPEGMPRIRQRPRIQRTFICPQRHP